MGKSMFWMGKSMNLGKWMEIWRFLDEKIPQWKVLKWMIGTSSSNGESRVLFFFGFSLGGSADSQLRIVYS